MCRVFERAGSTRNGANVRHGLPEKTVHLRCVLLDVRGTALALMEIACVTLGGMGTTALSKTVPTDVRAMGPARCVRSPCGMFPLPCCFHFWLCCDRCVDLVSILKKQVCHRTVRCNGQGRSDHISSQQPDLRNRTSGLRVARGGCGAEAACRCVPMCVQHHLEHGTDIYAKSRWVLIPSSGDVGGNLSR